MTAPTLSPREIRIRQRLKDDFPHYAAKCLMIKSGMAVKPLILNRTQLYIHQRIEEQLKRVGRVRVLVLKGRQQGCSTYVEGRFFWKVSNRKATQAFILTHEDAATANLFAMAQRYYEHCPELVRPHLGQCNAKDLVFDEMESGYKVGTAGSKQVGRSQTVHFFHGSEVAFWPNAVTHMAGVLQGVSNKPDTEIILESTSAGAQGLFHEMCKEAYAGIGEYELIFTPWYWHDDHRDDILAAAFTPTEEEAAYGALYGLDHGQLAFRRAKIQELRGVHVFRHEYPATIEEAFRAEMPGALWTRDLLDKTRVATFPTPLARIVVAVDPASKSNEHSNATGIIVAGKGRDGHAYVLQDVSMKALPAKWANAVVAAFDQWNGDRIVYESNQGGDLVAHTLQTVRKLLPLKDVTASKSKEARAEPISALYEKGMIHHVGSFPALEDELCTWVPGEESPDRLDAMVWAMTELMRGTEATPVAPTPDLGRANPWLDG